MPRAPQGKRIPTSEGVKVASKNPNGDGSVYYEGPKELPDGRKGSMEPLDRDIPA